MEINHLGVTYALAIEYWTVVSVCVAHATAVERYSNHP